ncbi:hypothetical protein K438DRAFT_1778439 [Mycena galopus ATCC 62051]|nr:hypothetical protein K438DRAFT_1778439 [Mycena galopus ATCC 62051]
MARVARNPELNLCPDFAGPVFQAARTAIVATVANKTNADVAANDETTRKQAELNAEAAAEKREADKKKPKLNGFDSSQGISDAIAPRPSVFTLRKLERFEYIELWYFTREGCDDTAASAANRTINEDAFALTKIDNVVGLRPASSFSTSRKVVKDIDLTWDQLSFAKNSMLSHMKKLAWPAKHVKSLADFWYSPETHTPCDLCCTATESFPHTNRRYASSGTTASGAIRASISPASMIT